MPIEKKPSWWERIGVAVTMCWILLWDWLTPWGALPLPERVRSTFRSGARYR